jgi:thiosulfate/3-mercaptopyruvate sulfurtransferase
VRIVCRSALTLAVTAAPLVAQQSAREHLLVTPKWVAAHLNDANLVLLQVGDKAKYDTQHIAGARYVMFSDIGPVDSATKLSLEIPRDDSLRARLARLGISDNSRIVVYADSGRYSQATRVILTLDYAGLGASTSLLDGGMLGWVKSGNPTTTAPTPEKIGTLSPLKTRRAVVSGEFVRDNLGKPGIAVIDARTSNYYDGTSEGGPTDARKKGHIPGALTVPFSSLYTDANELRTPEELQRIFSAAGVKPGDRIVGYCHIGQQATAMLFAARTLGHEVLLYDGSFEDWARRGWPVEVGPGKDK